MGSDIERRVLAFGEAHSSGETDYEHECWLERSKPDAEDIEWSLRNQGVPERIVNTLGSIGYGDTKEPSQAMEVVKNFLKTDRPAWCLVLSGDKGCGKSTAAALFLEDKTKAYQTVGNLPKKQAWWTAAKVNRVSSYDDQLENLMIMPWLIIDDLGVEYADKNGHFNSRLDELLSARYDNYKKTIITTNLNSKDFQERYGKRITSRIAEGFKHAGPVGETLFVEITEKSLRT